MRVWVVGVVRSIQNFSFTCHIRHSISSLERFGRRSSDFGRDFGRRSSDFVRFSGFEASVARSCARFRGFRKAHLSSGAVWLLVRGGDAAPPARPAQTRGRAETPRQNGAPRRTTPKKTRVAFLKAPGLSAVRGGRIFRIFTAGGWGRLWSSMYAGALRPPAPPA